MMSGAEHYEAAENLLGIAYKIPANADGVAHPEAQSAVKEAHVHAMLAVAAATLAVGKGKVDAMGENPEVLVSEYWTGVR